MRSQKGGLLNFLLVVIATLTMCGVADAGEIHEGRGRTKIAAMEQANKAAKEAAIRKNTGWKPARMQDVRQNPDGSWTARADSANHEGSLARGGYRRPTDPLPTFDAEVLSATPPSPSPSDKDSFASSITGQWEGEFRLSQGSRRWWLRVRLSFLEDGTIRQDGFMLEGQDKFYEPSDNNYGHWKLSGTTLIIQSPKNIGVLTLTRSVDGRSFSGRKEGSTTIETIMTRTLGPNDGTQKFLFFAAIMVGEGPCGTAQIVTNEVRTAEGREGVLEKQLSEETRSNYKSRYDTYETAVVPTTTHAIVFSYKLQQGGCTTSAVHLSEGKTKAEAEQAMAGYLARPGWRGTDPVVLREWPTPQDL